MVKRAAGTPKVLGDLLRKTREGLGLSIPELAAKLGIDRNTLGGYEREERRLPDLEFIAEFSAKTGAPMMDVLNARLAASPYSEKFTEVRRPTALEQPSAGYVYLPLYELKAGASPRGVLVEDGEHPVEALAFKEDWIRNTLRAAPADLRLIYVEGDSMEPDLRAGDIVLIDHTDTMARREGIYVLRMDDALLVKQVQRMPGGVVKLTSRNPAYEPITLPVPVVAEQGKYAIIGRVVWACRRF